MNQTQLSKAFITEYMTALNGVAKPREAIEKYVSDQPLIEHILFFESAFPNYEINIDELIAEGNKVVLRGNLLGKHEGSFGDVLPSHRTINFPLVVGYVIENNKIISHWLIADQTVLLEQLGVH